MSELITPYYKESEIYAHDGVKLACIHDKNCMWVATCFEQDADELLKRINGYEQLQSSSQQLVELAEECAEFLSTVSDYEKPLTLDDRLAEAITNAKQPKP